MEPSYHRTVKPIRARVQNGRLTVDEPTELPEGLVLDLVIDDGGDDLTEAERRALNEALAQSWEAAKAGRIRPADDVLADLDPD